MMRARPWKPFDPESEVFDSGVTVPLNDRGMPLRVPFVPKEGGPPQAVHTLIFDGLDGRYPAGTYVVTFEGTGLVEIWGDAGHHSFGEAGRYPLKVKPGPSGFRVVIRVSDHRDPIRNLHIWLPGFEGAKVRLHPEAGRQLKGFSVLRPMQTMSVNEGEYPCDNKVPAYDPTCVQDWPSRPTPTHFTQCTTRGIAVEYLVDLANQAGTDFWPGIPHAVTDRWIRNMAKIIKDRLDPQRRVYVELSNEIWNASWPYPQHYYFRAVGQRDKLSAADLKDEELDMGRRAYVRRAVEVFEIFEDVFGPEAKRRVVKVMPGFYGFPWLSERMLVHLQDKTLNPHGVRADSLAVGAYFGGEIIQELLAEHNNKIPTVKMVLDRAEKVLGKSGDSSAAETYASFAQDHGRIAKKYGVQLIAYEGGQHLLVGLGEEHPANEVVFQANRAPRMGRLYDKMFDLWFKNGGGIFVAYSFMEPFSPYGAFGHIEYPQQPLRETPKLRALRRWIKKSSPKKRPKQLRPKRVPVKPSL